MPNYRRFKSSITNNTQVFGIMGGLANRSHNGTSSMNRATSRLVIPSGPVMGLRYMQTNNLMSKNPQCAGGIGRIHHIGCKNGAIKSELKSESDNNTTSDIDSNTQDCSSCDGIDGAKGCVMKTSKDEYTDVCCTGSPDVNGVGCDSGDKICGIGGKVKLCGTDISSCPSNISIAQIRQLYEDNSINSFADIRNYCNVGDNIIKGPIKVWPGYRWDDFWKALEVFTDPSMDMKQPPVPGGGGSDDVSNIFLGTSVEEGAVIVSGFFAQSLYEANNYAVCDETDFASNRGQCSNGPCSCGNYGLNYTNGSGYTCNCPCDINENKPYPKMKDGCPNGPNDVPDPKLQPPCYGNGGCMDFCENNFSLNIDSSNNSNILTAPGEKYLSCKAGTDSAGCCWWGRGPTQLTGRNANRNFQNFLDINGDILGTIQDESKVTTSLCTNPGLTCHYRKDEGIVKTSNGYALVWLAALWDWTVNVQNSNDCVQTSHPFIQRITEFMSEKENNKLKTYNIPQNPLDNINGLDLPGCTCNQPDKAKICSEASWLSGIGNALNNGIWANQADMNNKRVCGNIKLLTQLNLMQETPMPRPKEYFDCNPNSIAE